MWGPAQKNKPYFQNRTINGSCLITFANKDVRIYKTTSCKITAATEGVPTKHISDLFSNDV